MTEVITFMEKLLEEMSDVSWCISEITEYKETLTDGKGFVAELPSGSTYEKQDDYYIEQIQHGDDWFSGTIIYPITATKALTIHYNC